MALSNGTRLGPYEIVASIGAGGMGEVYRARDGRLQRDVAVKVLPSTLALDPDRRARFEREAQAIAALSHPNILAIFDFGLDTDHRSDVFSFGAILYEMLTGRRAFAGGTEADTMSAILTADPPAIGDADVPPILDRLVRRCLEKSPDERFQSARDLAFHLDAISTTSLASGAVAAVGPPARASKPPIAWPIVALAIGLLAGAAGVWLALGRTRAPSSPVTFSQVTFRRGEVTAARFAPDGDTIVYSAAWEGRPGEVFATKVGAVGDRPLGIRGQLLAMSKTGEMALLTDIRVLADWMQVGTLARAPLSGGAPREIVRDVGDADWVPDGRELVITRYLDDRRRWRLEYPVGTVIYDTDRWIESPRVSRDGATVLLLEHPISGDNRGRVIAVSRDGKKADLTPEYSSLDGLAWSPAGDEAWFTAAVGLRLELLAARAGAPVRTLVPGPASIALEDVVASGRAIVQTLSLKIRMLARTPADDKERDITWFDYGILRDRSADGSLLLFEEEGEGGGANYSVFTRRTDGSPAVRLGDGYAGRFSPDLQWALTGSPAEPPNAFTIVPVGAGEPRKIRIPLEAIDGVGVGIRWFPDGKRLAVVGSEPGRRQRAYEFTIDSSALRPLTPEGTVGTLVSPDGKSLAATTPEGRQVLWPLDGGESRDIRGMTPQDVVLRWSADGRSLFVATPGPVTQSVSRIDLADGRRQARMTLAPSDVAGIRRIGAPVISADGRTYAYRYNQILSDLFVADGLR